MRVAAENSYTSVLNPHEGAYMGSLVWFGLVWVLCFRSYTLLWGFDTKCIFVVILFDSYLKGIYDYTCSLMVIV